MILFLVSVILLRLKCREKIFDLECHWFENESVNKKALRMDGEAIPIVGALRNQRMVDKLLKYKYKQIQPVGNIYTIGNYN